MSTISTVSRIEMFLSTWKKVASLELTWGGLAKEIRDYMKEVFPTPGRPNTPTVTCLSGRRVLIKWKR